jgi:Na+/H+-translocating membrane pyrophosphatase
MVIELIVGGVVAAGTYFYAKGKRASAGQSAAAAAVTGTGSAVATGVTMAIVSAFWPVVLVGGAVAGGYYYAKRRDQPKALPPSAEI